MRDASVKAISTSHDESERDGSIDRRFPGYSIPRWDAGL
jgi:hypothetical protein